MSQTTPTNPADLLAPLLALAERVRNMSNIEFVDQAREREEIVAELESLAAQRVEVVPVAVDDDKIIEILKKHFLRSHRAVYDALTFERSPPMFPQITYDVPIIGLSSFVEECVATFHPPQAQAENEDVLTETAIGKAFLSVLADPSHQWRLTGAKTFIDMVAALATEEPNDGWHPLSNPLPNSPITEQAQAGAGDTWLPIETCPRDGRRLILLLTPSRHPQVAYSNTWWTAGFSVECKPTHWAPIPPLDTAALEASHDPE